MARSRKIDIEPAVKLSRICFSCKQSFVLGHPRSPQQLCDKCRETLGSIIMERRSRVEQQENRNSVREEDV